MAMAGANRIGHSDRPLDSLDQDSLGLKPYAQGLAEFIAYCDTPFTVAVQGDWGTGKTSLMRMVQQILRPEADYSGQPQVEIVWFQTWQYSQFGSMASLPVSLLATLLECLSPDPGKLAQAKQVMGRLLKPVANAALRVSTMGATELGDFEGMLAKDSVDSAANANTLKKEVAEVVQRRLDAGADRIVVFVDDLDRIKPEIAVEILETIKLFVDWHGCVFVLALDYGVVSRGLEGKFGMGEADLGRSFFDKIIQLPFTVPVARYTVDKFIDALFRDMSLPMGEDDGELFAELVRWSVSVNPRGIKRVFNSLQLLIAMADARQDRLAIRILFAVLCLQIQYEAVYYWLLARGEALTEDDILGIREADETTRDPDLRAAMNSIKTERRDDFVRFARAFIAAMQDPGRPGDDIDAVELARVREVLTLSRVTSVAAPGAKAPSNDPEFRWRNRELIGKVRKALDHRLAADIETTGSAFWVNTAHQTSNVYLRRNVTPGGELTLVLDHGEDGVSLYLEGGKRAVRGHADLLRSLLQPIAAPWEESPDEGPLFYRRPMAGMAMEERERLLTGEVLEVYMRAQAAMKDRLWR